MNNSTVEGFKQFLRIAYSALLSYALTQGVLQGILTAVFGTHLDPTIIITITGILTSILSGLDKANHEVGNKSVLDMDSGLLDKLKG